MAFPSIENELPDPWPFDQPPNCAVFTTRHVFRDQQPITQVSHDSDDEGWQFHYSGEKTISDAMIVSLKEVYFHDPTIIEIADLPPGWKATRESIGSLWKREPESDDAEMGRAT